MNSRAPSIATRDEYQGLFDKLAHMWALRNGEPSPPVTPPPSSHMSAIPAASFLSTNVAPSSRRLFATSDLGITVRQVMNHSSLGPRFRESAKARHADEGIQFLDDLFKLSANDRNAESASVLLEKYFVDGAPLWVNLSADVRSDLFQRYQAGIITTVHGLFELAVLEVMLDLKRGDAFRHFCLTDEEAIKFADNASVYVLTLWLAQKQNFRVGLIASAHDTQTCNLLRFCVSVIEYEKLPERAVVERKAKGNVIASTFVQNGSRFQVASLVKLYVDAILKGEYDSVLEDARVECLRELSRNAEIMDLARMYAEEV